MRIVRYSLALVFGAFVGACGMFPDVDETKGWSAEQLYSEAKDRLNNGIYEEAIKYYNKLEARYPTAATRSRHSSRSPTPTTRTRSPRRP
jgi:outer membrane protein assembly factor BamD